MASWCLLTIFYVGWALLVGVRASPAEFGHLADRPGCGIIPKVKVRYRSRDPGISSFGQVPWQVAIFTRPDNIFLCSATLISSRWVITSPTCLLGVRDYSDLEIRLGDWNLSEDDSFQETYEHFSASIKNSVFIPDTHIAHDVHPKVLLLKLDKAIQFANYPQVVPACLPAFGMTVNASESKKCFVSGWGSYNHVLNGAQSRPYDINPVEDESSSEVETRFPFHSKREQEEILLPDTEFPDDSFDAFDSGNNREDNSLEFLTNPKATSDSPVIHEFHAHHLVPDPVEDYMDEVNAEKSAANALVDPAPIVSPAVAESTVNSHQDVDFNSPFLDSIYPIAEHHEMNIHKHKLKYKQGKIKGARRIVKIKKHLPVGEDDFVRNPPSGKRFTRSKRYSGRNRRNRKVLYSNHADPEKASFLKLFQVDLHDNCSPVDANNVHKISNHKKVCISPANGHFHMFPCMIDVGSPVFCTSSDEKEPNENEATTKSILVGFVKAKSPLCYGKSEYFDQLQQLNSVGVKLITTEELETIVENIHPKTGPSFG